MDQSDQQRYAIGVPGQLARCYVIDDAAGAARQLRDGEVAVLVGAAATPLISADGTHALPPPPPPLPERRRRCWEQARACRDARMTGGCDTPLGFVDTDERSQGKIGAAVQGATLAQLGGRPFEVVWTMADNRTVPHDAAAMIAMGLAVFAHVTACQQAGTAIREAIIASDAPEAIDITAGYPATFEEQTHGEG